MEKFTKKEYEIVEMVRQGKTKGEITEIIKTTPQVINTYFSGVYKKTDEFVCYHSERNKFEELQGYLRRNPTMFSPVPDSPKHPEYINQSIEKEIKSVLIQQSQKEKNKPVEQNSPKLNDINSILNKLFDKYSHKSEIVSAKIEVLNEIKNELRG